MARFRVADAPYRRQSCYADSCLRIAPVFKETFARVAAKR